MDNLNDSVRAVLIQIRKEIEPHLDETDLVTNGLIDSLDIMNLIMKLEETFDIEIDPEDVVAENFDSVAAIIALINKCRGQSDV
mgnify:CR=1 FL=1